MLLEDNEEWNRVTGAPAGLAGGPGVRQHERCRSSRILRSHGEERLDAACVMMASRDTERRSLRADLSFQSLAAAMVGRSLRFVATNPDIEWPVD
ncbi:MAG: hypothetical protein R2713_10530 [Ilumatobacteraceae bacterium]